MIEEEKARWFSANVEMDGSDKGAGEAGECEICRNGFWYIIGEIRF